MLTQKWQTSERKYRVREERDFTIPAGDGTKLNTYLFRPDTEGQFPVILGVCAYSLEDQIAPVMPVGAGGIRGHMEAGDPNFYVSRGYVHIIMNVRGTGKSEGFYDFLGRREIQDIYDAIEWLAKQPWCNGKVGMFGRSYFTMVQKRVAALNPPALKCVFAMYGLTDLYRDLDYHGGILHHNFRTRWIPKLANLRFKNRMKEKLGEEEYRRRVQGALNDAEIAVIPPLVEALREPDKGRNAWIVEPLLFPQYSEFWQEWHEATHGDLNIPAYLGSCWGVYGIHLAGDMRSWEEWQGRKNSPSVRRSISIVRSINTTTNRCAGSVFGLKATTPESWTSRPCTYFSTAARVNGSNRTNGRCRRRAGRRFTCTSMVSFRSTNSGPTNLRPFISTHPTNAAARSFERRRSSRPPTSAVRWR